MIAALSAQDHRLFWAIGGIAVAVVALPILWAFIALRGSR